MDILSKDNCYLLPKEVIIPNFRHSKSQIVHIGIGGFHRSHQAYAISRLLEIDPVNSANWKITGVGLMPNDKSLVHNFRQQQGIYCLRTVAADQSEEVRVIDAIAEMLHAEEDAEAIIDRIADQQTKVISFTITEGGYMFDFEKQEFKIHDDRIQQDLRHKENPQTVFGFLAKGLRRRCDQNGPAIILLSCDNILGNGNILKLAVLSFLQEYDPELKDWADQNIEFPNSMVDRITPVPNAIDRELFYQQYGLNDNCLVVAEDYFQWIIEKHVGDPNFPALQKIGVEFVADVSAYEAMKLGILNAGHTLVGLLGDYYGYETIHTAVNDPVIVSLFNRFVKLEVIPQLAYLPNVDYETYFEQVKTRFSNAMINDSTARIISGSSDKFPKFVLPIILKQLKRKEPALEYSAIIVAAWWAYLNKEKHKNNMANVQDQLKSIWIDMFADESFSIDHFIGYKPVFGNLKEVPKFYQLYKNAIISFQKGDFFTYYKTL